MTRLFACLALSIAAGSCHVAPTADASETTGTQRHVEYTARCVDLKKKQRCATDMPSMEAVDCGGQDPYACTMALQNQMGGEGWMVMPSTATYNAGGFARHTLGVAPLPLDAGAFTIYFYERITVKP